MSNVTLFEITCRGSYTIRTTISCVGLRMNIFLYVKCILVESTVLPAKSDSDIMVCLQTYQGLIIARSLVYQSYPQDRINTSDLSISVSSNGVYKLIFYFTIVNKILRHCHSWLTGQYVVAHPCVVIIKAFLFLFLNELLFIGRWRPF